MTYSHKMRPQKPLILVNALKLHQGPHRLPTGNFQIVLHLAAELGQNGEFDVRFLTDLDSYPPLSKQLESSRLIRTNLSGNSILAADWAVVGAVRRLRPTIYHRPTGQLPFMRLPCRTIAGIADISFMTLPYPPLRRLYKEASYRWTTWMADRVTCISRFTYDEVALRLKVPKQRLRVVPLGANPMPAPDYSSADSRSGPFFVVFAHQTHKNPELCFEAFSHVAKANPTAWLAIIGKNDYVDKLLKPLAKKLGIDASVQFIGAPDAAQLTGLYDRAIGLLFPSRFEGFGMPVLEAMGRGCPVVCSNVCSLPEVAGSAAVLLDPDDLNGMTSAMFRLLDDPEWRGRLVASGYAQAQKFTWKKTAECTEEIYRELLSEQQK